MALLGLERKDWPWPLAGLMAVNAFVATLVESWLMDSVLQAENRLLRSFLGAGALCALMLPGLAVVALYRRRRLRNERSPPT